MNRKQGGECNKFIVCMYSTLGGRKKAKGERQREMRIGGDALGLPRPYRRGRRNGSKEEAEAGNFGCSGWMGSGVREWGGKYGK